MKINTAVRSFLDPNSLNI